MGGLYSMRAQPQLEDLNGWRCPDVEVKLGEGSER